MYLEGVAMAANIFTVVSLSIERYLAIVYPLRCRMLQPMTRPFGILVFIWSFAMIEAIPYIIIYRYMKTPYIQLEAGTYGMQPRYPGYAGDTFPHGEIYSCTVPENMLDELLVLRWVELLLLYIIPITVMTVCYSRIGYRLWHRGGTTGLPGSSQDSPMRKRVARHVIRLLVLTLVLFSICWGPWTIYLVIVSMKEFSRTPLTLSLNFFFSWLSLTNTAHNPITYTLLQQRFRKSISDTLFGRKAKCNRIHPRFDASLRRHMNRDEGDGQSSTSQRELTAKNNNIIDPPIFKVELASAPM